MHRTTLATIQATPQSDNTNDGMTENLLTYLITKIKGNTRLVAREVVQRHMQGTQLPRDGKVQEE